MKKLMSLLFVGCFIESAFAAGLYDLDLGDNPYMAVYKKTDSVVIIDAYDKISDLARRYSSAVSREQSFANRILGAAAIGAGGIGGMMLVSGIAEQRADENAQRDMMAYISTFTCDYGMGRNITGGETNVTLPIIDISVMRNEYITLASEIKSRKEMLEMSPGIEATIISDATASGLYDNASVGKTDGGYTSVYRALTQEHGKDSQDMITQASKTNRKITTGGIVGGVGVVGGTVGNILINNVFDDTNKNDNNKK